MTRVSLSRGALLAAALVAAQAAQAAQAAFMTPIGTYASGVFDESAADRPNGFPLLVVGNEVSGATTIYQVPEPGSLALAGLGAAVA